MQLSTGTKNKVNLSDYSYQRDIKNRLLMSTLSAFDIEVLQEILSSSIRIKLTDLTSILEVDLVELQPSLNKLAESGLFEFDGDLLLVNKVMRKYYDFYVEMFDEDFRPDLDFLAGLLKQVPVSTLPGWYSLPRTADNIFSSLVEKFLSTPKIYRDYLQELFAEDPILQEIVNDVFQAPQFSTPISTLCEKHGLDVEQFHETLLFLEFNFVCCLGFEKSGDQWIAVVTPFHEWREHLRFLHESQISSIETPDQAQSDRDPMQLIRDAHQIITLVNEQQVSLSELEGSDNPNQIHILSQAHVQQIVDLLINLKLITKGDQTLSITRSGVDWMEMTEEDKAVYFFRHPLTGVSLKKGQTLIQLEKDCRQVEKSLRRILGKDWVYLEDFLSSMIEELSTTDALVLKKVKRWSYARPQYGLEEQEFIRQVLFERLSLVGFLETGRHDGKICLRLTDLGVGTLYS